MGIKSRPPAMFPFDPSALPQITARRAFIGVDFQQAFTEAGGLPVANPPGYVHRATELAAAIRETNGDVIWVRSKFDKTRQLEEERIVVSDEAKPAKDPLPTEAEAAVDKEAFLSHDTAEVLAGDGLEWSSGVADQIVKTDLTLAKTTYSAFKGTRLLHMLRAKMVMEVFICGSLANVGVFATAMDAACHGLSITIVQDCCGYISESRQQRAVKSLVDFTGCEVATLKDTLDLIRPPLPKPHQGEAAGSKSPDLVRPMTALSLASDSPEPPEQLAKLSLNSPRSTGEPGDSPAPEDAVKEPSVTADTTTATLPPPSQPESQNSSTHQADPSPSAESTLDAPAASSSSAPDPTQEAAPAVPRESESDRSVTPPEVSSSQSVPPKPKGSSPLNQERDDDGEAESSRTKLCEGDTDVIVDLLPKDLEDGIFDTLRTEVKWQRMSHQGGEVPRLVAVQGHVAEDGSIPVYRHPADESPPLLPFTPTVRAIKEATEKRLGHPLNHVLIQYYRDGNDYISEHSDKTLDIVRSSYIANLSLGAERTMVLRTKRQDRDPSRPSAVSPSSETDKRTICRAKLPHNSLLRMGLATNMKWLHAIRQDKRSEREKSPLELAFNGGRISLTFRHIATFLSSDETLIWGQGATSKTQDKARPVKNGQCAEAVEMLKAFGTENRSSNFDWDSHYGAGFDVLHMSTSARFFTSEDPLANLQVVLMLAEFGISYAKGGMGPMKQGQSLDFEALPIKFVDSTEGRPTVQGDVPIFLYLDAVYGTTKGSLGEQDQAQLAKRYTRFHQAISLSRKLQRGTPRVPSQPIGDVLERELTTWDRYLAEADGEFLAGSEASLPDFLVWPVLHTLVQQSGLEALGSHGHLKDYYGRFTARESVKKVTTDGASSILEST